MKLQIGEEEEDLKLKQFQFSKLIIIMKKYILTVNRGNKEYYLGNVAKSYLIICFYYGPVELHLIKFFVK